MSKTVYKRAIDLMEAEVGDELVALDAERGECFGFNEVATKVWRLLEQPRTFHELQEALVAEYEVEPTQCERDLRELLDDLSSRGLVASRN